MFGQQVCDDFRVGLTLKGNAVSGELAVQFLVVLNDPVVNDRDAAIVAEMRVGVFNRGFAVRGPTRVPNADIAAKRGGGENAGEGIQFADSLTDVEFTGVDDADTSGIVAAVLKAPQALETDLWSLTGADVTYYATHGVRPFDP